MPSPYARATPHGANSGGSSYANATPASGKPAKKQGGGGFLGGVRHVASQTLSDLETAAVNSPGGLYATGKALSHDTAAAFGHLPSASPYATHAAGEPSELKPIGKALALGFKEDFQHPLRHPGFTGLDILGVASLGAGTAARVAAGAGRVAETGRLAEGLGALAKRPVPSQRVLRSQGIEVKVPASRSALTRGVTRQIDALRERFPDAHIGIHDQPTRVGRALARERGFQYKLHTTPFVQLRAAGRRIRFNSPEGRALRAVAEGTPLRDVIRTAQESLTTAANDVDRKALRREIALARKTVPLVKETAAADGTIQLALSDPKLQALYEKTKAAALLEDERMAKTGQLPAEIAGPAISKPAAIYGSQRTQPEFHVGQERRPKPFSIQKQPVVGSAGTIGIPKTPGRLTHELTGKAIRRGGLRHDVPALVADNALESERHAALLRARDFFVAHAQDTPEGLARPVAIRLDELKGKPFPDRVRLMQDAYAAGRRLDANETGLLGLTFDSFRQHVFPEIDAADVGATPGVKWIDERLLGGLNKPRPLTTALQHPGLRRAATFVDAVNNATKFSILYLKPAYAAPNILGNAFLTLTQQGWAAPANIGRAVQLARKIGPEDTAVIDNLMGEGITASLAARGGLVAGATSKGAGFWSKIVDLPFRRASFLYEARKAGYTDPARLRKLLHDPTRADHLNEIQQRANRALIEYGDLTPVEQDVIRRVLFFYPWLKGSTRYAGEYVREHPQQAALIGQEGKQGKALQEDQLGAVPPFAEGLFQVGTRGGNPLVSNPTAAGILGQPADLAAIASGLLGGHVPQGRELSSLLTPFLGAGNVTLSGYDPFTGRAVEPNLRTFGKQLIQGQPIPTLINRLRNDQSQRMFPLTPRDAILQILAGTIAPRPVNKQKLNAAADRAAAPRR